MLAETQKLFDALTQLPDDHQAQFATRLLEELRWELTLNQPGSIEALDALREKAEIEIRSGRAYDLDDVLEGRVIPQ